MVVDTSAIIAILRKEDGYESLRDQLVADSRRLLSSATYVELCVVIGAAQGEIGLTTLDSFLEEFRLNQVSLTALHAAAAREAWMAYGRGRHRAKLNFGDCFSYALAKVSGEPLLFKGNDFALTDIQRA